MKKLILGILASVIFIYFSLRGVEFDKIFAGFKNVNSIFLLPTMVLLLLESLLKSLRWGVILSPIERISQRRLFPLTCVGNMALILSPMRTGEVVRPYLVSKESKVPLSSSLAVILVERVFDILTILGVLFLLVFSSTLPDWLQKAGYGTLVILVFLVFFMLLSYFKLESILSFFGPLLNKLPHKLQGKIDGLVHTFVDGFKIISSPKRLVYVFLLSALMWGFPGLVIYTLFFFYNFQLSIVNALVVLVIITIGLSLPTAPGLLGNFQYACIVALSLCGIPKSDALSFSMIYYFMAIGRIIVLGLVCLPLVKVSFKWNFASMIK